MRLDDHRCESRTRRRHPARLQHGSDGLRRSAVPDAPKKCGDWPTAADAHRARNAAFAPGIGIGADESRAPPSAPSARHDDGSSGEEGVIALIPRSSVYVARFITTAGHHILRGVPRDADGGRRTRTSLSYRSSYESYDSLLFYVSELDLA